VNAFGKETDRLLQHDRAVTDVLPEDPVVDVDDGYVRCDLDDHAVADADELVLQPVVG
jgi:hypothetical protein